MRIILLLLLTMAIGCTVSTKNDKPVRFMVADPGHFHASLVFKEMHEDAGDVEPDVSKVYVFAPVGAELEDFRSRVDGYNNRSENPTHWDFSYYTGADFFSKMLSEKPGNVLVLAGNNQKKTGYILDAIKADLNVFSDKPMAINPEDFEMLKEAFTQAGEKSLLLYDIMTERFEITSILQKELMHIPEIFGELTMGTPEDPAVIKESVHHFFKYVSGKKLQRPPWFFDVEQEGEGIVDVTTHLVDLIQWACFPEKIIDYHQDVALLDADRWATQLNPAQFFEVTGSSEFPSYLEKDIDANGNLQVYCNGSILYQLFRVNSKVQVIWNFQAPEGGGDTHFSVVKGTLANLEIRQGAEQGYRPELYLIPVRQNQEYLDGCAAAIIRLEKKYAGIKMIPEGNQFRISIPDHYRIGHEAHFGQVTKKFIEYMAKGALPDWEVPNMLAKYYLTTQALIMANTKQ